MFSAEVVGHSRLMREDEAGTLARRKLKSSVSTILTLDQQRGVALVVVLWGLVLIAIIADSIATESRTEVQMAFNVAENAKARALAGGLSGAVVQRLSRPIGPMLVAACTPLNPHLSSPNS